MVFLYFAGYLWMKILKAINNNIVSARDENGKEIVVMGRGIGFKCREGDSIPPEAIEKIFHMDTQNETDRLKQLFSSMPLEHIEVTNRIIAYARKCARKDGVKIDDEDMPFLVRGELDYEESLGVF